MKGTVQELAGHASTEAFDLTLHTAGRKIGFKVWLDAKAFDALPGASNGVATVRYVVGGKKGFVQMPVYLARAIFIACRRCCANVISTQYGSKRSKAGK
jgi:hypothetical protein